MHLLPDVHNCMGRLWWEAVNAVTACLDSQDKHQNPATTVIRRRHLLSSRAGGKLTFHYGNIGRANKSEGGVKFSFKK